jgi:decaprenylphospho-beta-D-erythro-pentofuranosid-2-ulose 2-reductase
VVKDALGRVDSVLLLGGRSEIGLAIARRLVADGARHVVLTTRAGGSTDETDVESLRAAGASSVESVELDIADIDAHPAAVEDAFKRLGDVDVVVDAIGVLGSQDAYSADPALAAASITTNLTGHVSVCLDIAQRLRAQGHGTLVVLSSIAGSRVRKANFVYGAAKAGLDGFAQGLGDSLVGSGARVMVVRPGFVRTKMTAGMDEAPMSADADDVAEGVANGLRRGSETVWVPAKLAAVAFVFRLLPRPLWRRLPR